MSDQSQTPPASSEVDPNAAPPTPEQGAAVLPPNNPATSSDPEGAPPNDPTSGLTMDDVAALRQTMSDTQRVLEENAQLREQLTRAQLDKFNVAGTPPETPLKGVHVVTPGDTIQSIADHWEVPVDVLLAVNAKAISDEANARGFPMPEVPPGPVQASSGAPHPESMNKVHLFADQPLKVPA